MAEFLSSSWGITLAMLAGIVLFFAVGALLLRGEINGRKFFSIFALFFVVIIVVNVVMARFAVGTFPGLEVANSYVASQTFDDDRAQQESLGWTISADVVKDELHLYIRDAGGDPVEVKSLTGVFGRATTVRDDQTPEFRFDGQRYVAPVDARGGNWNLRMEAEALDGTPFKQRVVVLVEH